VKYVADSTKGFTLMLAGLTAFLEHGVRLNLIADATRQGLLSRRSQPSGVVGRPMRHRQIPGAELLAVASSDHRTSASPRRCFGDVA
jgi:hypothetical protein